MHQQFFDDEEGIYRVFSDGDFLDDYPNHITRWFAMQLMDRYFPADAPYVKLYETTAEYEYVTQGRATAAYKTRDFFSTCGELAMWLMERLGYVGNVLNRDLDVYLPEETGGGQIKRRYRFGKNMSYIFNRSKREDVWVQHKNDNRPEPGDIIFVADFPISRTEHVLVFKGTIIKDGKEYWVSYDAGQYVEHRYEQCVKIRERRYNRLHGTECLEFGPGDNRQVHGWIDITQLDLDRPTTLAKVPA